MLGVVKVRIRNTDGHEDVDALTFRYACIANPWSPHVLSKAQKLVYINFAALHPNSTIIKAELFNDIKQEWAQFNQGGFA